MKNNKKSLSKMTSYFFFTQKGKNTFKIVNA